MMKNAEIIEIWIEVVVACFWVSWHSHGYAENYAKPPLE
jgi:hypothetical protein